MILVISSPKTYACKRLFEEAKKASIPLTVIEANHLSAIDPAPFKVLYVRNPFVNYGSQFLPNVVEFAKDFKNAGKKVVDQGIAFGDLALGKWDSYKRLEKFGILMPKTNLATHSPKEYPVIVKWIYGFKAKQVYLARDEDQLDLALSKHPQEETLLQEFIPAQYEYKFMTVGYKALPVAVRLKMKDSGFKIDFSSAQSIQIFQLPQELVNIAEKASRLLGRELAKVDILEKDGQFYVLEVNRCPGLKSFEKITKFNVAGEFLKYLSRTE